MSWIAFDEHAAAAAAAALRDVAERLRIVADRLVRHAQGCDWHGGARVVHDDRTAALVAELRALADTALDTADAAVSARARAVRLADQRREAVRHAAGAP